jgi:hypothetical protein
MITIPTALTDIGPGPRLEKATRPKGVTAIAILHFLAGLLLIIAAVISFSAGEDRTLTSASVVVLAGVVLVGSYGLWR